jgi:hypothetical protein
VTRPTLSRLGTLLLAALLLVLAAAALWRVEGGWWFSDDSRYVRWVLEHRGRPLDALWADVFHHRRPATLWAWYLGLVLSDGAPWGPRLLLHLGLWLGVAGAGAWAWTLGGEGRQRRAALAALLALALVAGDPAMVELAGWSSWMASAWEAAASTWAMALATSALRRGSWPRVLGALGLTALAGSFQEAGWLVAPAVLIVLAITAPPGRRSWAPAGLAATLAVCGSVLCWEPTNLTRYQGAAGDMGSMLLEHAAAYSRLLVSGWLGTDSGVPAPLLVLAVLGLFLGRRSKTALPLVALGIYAAIMLPAAMGPRMGHVWGALLALTVFTASALADACAALPRRWSTAALAVVAVMASARLPGALEAHTSPDSKETRAHEQLVQVSAALARATGGSTICAASPRAGAPLTLLPLYGAELEPGRPTGRYPIVVGGDAVISGGAEPTSGQRTRTRQGHAHVELDAGLWVLLQPVTPGQEGPAVQARSSCGPVPSSLAPPSLPGTGWIAQPLELEAGCARLDLVGPSDVELILIRIDDGRPHLPTGPVGTQRRVRCETPQRAEPNAQPS